MPIAGPTKGILARPQLPGGIFGGGVPQQKPQGILGGQQQPRRDWGFGLQVLGAGLRDIADPSGQNLTTVQATNADRIAAQQEAQEAERRRAELMMQADQLGLTGRERVAFMLNPDEWSKTMSGNLALRDVSQGENIYDPAQGRSVYSGPVSMSEGERLLDPSAGYSVLAEGAPKTTDDMREYALAQQQGFQGSFTDFDMARRRAGASSTTVNVPGQPQIGSIPQGYAAVQDPQTGGWTMQPIPGGPAEMEITQSQEQQAMRRAQQLRAADIVTDDLGRFITMIEEAPRATTGVGGFASRNIPATPAFNANALSTTIKANLGFDRLQQMRESSPTGGALGPVSDFENRNLQATSGNLDTAQSADQLSYNAKRIFNQYMDTVHGTPDHIQQMVQQGAVPQEVAEQLAFRYDLTSRRNAPARITSDEEYDRLPSGSEFIGPDGVTRRKP